METTENKIRKGQAYNLSVQDANISTLVKVLTEIALKLGVEQGRLSKNNLDPKYIFQQFIYYYNLADIVQGSDLDLIEEVLNKPDFLEAVKNLKESVE